MRRYQVIVFKKAVNGRIKDYVSYPPNGFPHYTGKQAIKVMKEFKRKRPGLKTVALTKIRIGGQTHDETLTLKEMLEVVL